MKKLFALILTVSLVAALSGCETLEKLKAVELPELPEITAEPQPETIQEAPEIEADAAIEIAVEELSNPVIVNTVKTTKLFYDPNKETKLILTFAYDTPKVTINGREEAAGYINEYLGILDETYYTGNDYGLGGSYGVNYLYELAIDRYTYLYNTGVRDGAVDLVSSREAVAARADNKVLSMVYNDYVYISPEEESHEYKAYNFDTENGDLLTLEALSSDYNAFSAAVMDCMSRLARSEEYSEVLSGLGSAENALAPIFREGSWFFGNDGMVFFTKNNELCENSGIVRFTIPYSELIGVIDSRFIPSERLGNGKAQIILQDNYEDGSIEIIDLVNISDDGEGLVLIADGTIYDVCISSVAYDNNSSSFMTVAEHWFCSYMQDSAVQISVMIPDGMPNLMVSYRNGEGELIQKLVTESGEDGSIILMNTDITPVG